VKRFDYYGAYPYLRMLQRQIAGDNDSWAVRWYASALLADKLTLYPGRSLVHNIGTDESGTHCTSSTAYDTQVAVHPVRLGGIPIEEDRGALRAFEAYFRSIRLSFFGKIRQRLKLR